MIIRDAVKSEYQYLRELRLKAYEEHAAKIPIPHWEALKSSILGDNDSVPGIERIVAEVDGQIVGSVVLFPAKIKAYQDFETDQLEFPELRMLATTPEARGKGVATSLIRECMKRSKEQGYIAMGLHTADFMNDAMQLYTNLGFKRLPEFDFEPANDGIIVKAFQIDF